MKEDNSYHNESSNHKTKFSLGANGVDTLLSELFHPREESKQIELSKQILQQEESDLNIKVMYDELKDDFEVAHQEMLYNPLPSESLAALRNFKDQLVGSTQSFFSIQKSITHEDMYHLFTKLAYHSLTIPSEKVIDLETIDQSFSIDKKEADYLFIISEQIIQNRNEIETLDPKDYQLQESLYAVNQSFKYQYQFKLEKFVYYLLENYKILCHDYLFSDLHNLALDSIAATLHQLFLVIEALGVFEDMDEEGDI